MSTLQRYLSVSGKTLTDLLIALNDPDLQLGRVVYIEKTRAGYTAILDTYAIITVHISEIQADEEQEAERRKHNQMLLQKMLLDMSKAA